MVTPTRYARIRRVLDRRQPDLTVLMEKVHKPHNFAAILRSCDAVGVYETHAVLLKGRDQIKDLTSQGTGKWVRTRIHRRLKDAVTHLSERGFQILAAHPSPEALPFQDVDYKRPTAIMLGTELYGLSKEAVQLAHHQVVVPMAGMGSSLNVSVAAALILYEAFRQRMEKGMYERSRLNPKSYRKRLFEWAYPEVANYCRRKKIPYPRLGSRGEILEKFT